MAEMIAMFSVLAVVLHKFSQLTVFHIEPWILRLEFRDRKAETWIKQTPPNEIK